MDGTNSEIFGYFKSLLTKGFHEIRKHLEDILILIEIFMKGTFFYLLIYIFRFKVTLFYKTSDSI